MKLAVAIIHGMGSQKDTFAEPIKQELTDRFANLKGRKTDLVFESIYWAPVLNRRESELWNKVITSHDLDYVKLRQFVISALGDAIAYQPLKAGAQKTKDVYTDIHRIVRKSLSNLATQAGPGVPLLIIAHSLGSIIISNYLWDLWKPAMGATPPMTPLEGGETLAGLVTFGSPMALWSLRYYNYGEPIGFPHRRLKQRFPKIKPKWLNFFDDDDILAYPLRDLNSKYRKRVSQDIPISVGGFFSGWNPLSHTRYWTDNDFTKPVTELLHRIWKDAQ